MSLGFGGACAGDRRAAEIEPFSSTSAKKKSSFVKLDHCAASGPCSFYCGAAALLLSTGPWSSQLLQLLRRHDAPGSRSPCPRNMSSWRRDSSGSWSMLSLSRSRHVLEAVHMWRVAVSSQVICLLSRWFLFFFFFPFSSHAVTMPTVRVGFCSCCWTAGREGSGGLVQDRESKKMAWNYLRTLLKPSTSPISRAACMRAEL
jgi:hypothetical protein